MRATLPRSNPKASPRWSYVTPWRPSTTTSVNCGPYTRRTSASADPRGGAEEAVRGGDGPDDVAVSVDRDAEAREDVQGTVPHRPHLGGRAEARHHGAHGAAEDEPRQALPGDGQHRGGSEEGAVGHGGGGEAA